MPIAGAGTRFAMNHMEAYPKPLIAVAGRPLIDWATRNLMPEGQGKWIFIARHDHSQAGSKLEQILRALGSEVLIQ